MSLLRLQDVTCRYGAVTAVDHLSLEVTAGARHAIIGPNGAGKSSVLSVIAGSTRPATGTITFNGQMINRQRPHIRARHGIARTFQHPAVAGHLTAADNLALALTGHRSLRAQLARTRTTHVEAQRVLDEAGLGRYAGTTAADLSYGLRRRLELTMALAVQPRLFLLDEPSAGLDPDEIAALTATIRALSEQVTVLIVDHRLDLIWGLADTVTVLHHGQHLATGSPDAVRATPAVQSAYLNPAAAPALAPGRPLSPQSSAVPLLQTQGLSAGHDGAPVLRDITLEVAAGDVLAVLGRNGAGKTTLLNTLAGLHPAITARIEFDGKPLARQPHAIARTGVALVPQGRRLFDLSVAEHLTVAERTSGRTAGQWTRDRVLDLLPALRPRLSHHATQLSGGEQQMLALARALLAGPRLLLLDEPTEGLAPAIVADLAAVIHRITGDGITVLLAEQNLGWALQVASRVVVLDQGRIALDTPARPIAEPDRRRLDDLLGLTPIEAPQSPLPMTSGTKERHR